MKIYTPKQIKEAKRRAALISFRSGSYNPCGEIVMGIEPQYNSTYRRRILPQLNPEVKKEPLLLSFVGQDF